MAISSNSIIHFTATKEALQGILSENFRLKYCKESIDWMGTTSVIHVPMVSFCDIPLSQVKSHIDSYGAYGIGLTREWAVRSRLNPVLYVEANSFLSESYKRSLQRIGTHGTHGHTNEWKLLSNISRYMKNYEGTLKRVGRESIENYRFSDEREWRYVPPISDDHEMLYTASQFSDLPTKQLAEKSIEGKRLAFSPNDIKYIILRQENEIDGFIRFLEDVKGAGYTLFEVRRLLTRILTADQIRSDF